MRSIANGISVNYEVAGEGAPVVLIHGLAMDLSFWDHQVPALAAHFEVIRYDARGHGASEQANPPYSLELMADDLDHFMRSIGVRAAHLVGLSMGGMIAQTYALSHPNDILSLTLASTTSEYPPEGRQTFRERAEAAHDSGMRALLDGTLTRWFTEDYRRKDPPELRTVRRVVLGTNPGCFAGAALAVSGVDTTSRLAQIELPTLVIAAENDVSTPIASAKRIHEQIAGSRLKTIAGASHCCNIERPEEFNGPLLDFLRGVSSPDSG